MSKEFEDKLKAMSMDMERRRKELEENDLIVDYDEEREEVYVVIWKKVYIFDQKGYKLFEKLWNKGVLQPNKNNYLCVKDDWNDLVLIHRYLKEGEVEELAKKLNCPSKDVHVHHKDKKPENNFLDNLEVLHKDEHARRHGNFDTWEQYQKWREEKGLNSAKS